MNDKPRRPWFHIHLSTAIVLMFVAGGLLWKNLDLHEGPNVILLVDAPEEKFSHRGWPWPFFEIGQLGGTDWDYYMLCFDVVLSLLIIHFVAKLCEWRIRRREARAP